jgi:DHA1 family inner membrane transport protein
VDVNTTTRPGSVRFRSSVALAALALGSFVIGTAELVIVGILSLIAEDLSVSVSTAGHLVTVYALGISVGGPIVTAVTIRFGRRTLLWLALVIYLAGNLFAVYAVGFGALLAARLVTGSIHGLFIGVASSVAAGLVTPDRRGQAMATVFGGIAVATVLGVPLGTLIGQALGWRATFVGIVALAVVALVATLFLVPSVPSPVPVGLRAQARSAFAPRVVATLAVGFLLLGGQFTVLTFLAPYLEEVTGIDRSLISAFLLTFGVASAVGTFYGGRFADRSPTRTLVAANVLLVAALGVLYLLGASPVPAAVALGLWGLVGFGLVPSLQLRVITLAGAGGDLAATLGASAVNAGIAVGALVGGLALASGGPDSTVLTGLVVCAVALPATWAVGLFSVPAATPDSVTA